MMNRKEIENRIF